MPKKVVIIGSVALQTEIKKCLEYWSEQADHIVIDYPQVISDADFMNEYPKVHLGFLKHIAEADILFVANEDKNNIEGYIGAETFAEIGFGIAQNKLYNKNIEIILAKMPSANVQSFEEIGLWLKLGWIKVKS